MDYHEVMNNLNNGNISDAAEAVGLYKPSEVAALYLEMHRYGYLDRERGNMGEALEKALRRRE